MVWIIYDWIIIVYYSVNDTSNKWICFLFCIIWEVLYETRITSPNIVYKTINRKTNSSDIPISYSFHVFIIGVFLFYITTVNVGCLRHPPCDRRSPIERYNKIKKYKYQSIDGLNNIQLNNNFILQCGWYDGWICFLFCIIWEVL